MKNIHLIPTDKPSRLGYLTKKGKEVYKDLRLFDKPMPNILDSENQHIYITSDEEIKEGDWCLHLGKSFTDDILSDKITLVKISERYLSMNSYFWKQWDKNSQFSYSENKLRKIILTTDQDLINDDIQAIDDEFLEWFVNNPSCEFIQTKRLEDGQYFDYLEDNSVIEGIYENYKIIIPQEEFKQEPERGITITHVGKQETKMIECYFIPNNNTSSATICGNCGKEKFLHTIGSGIKAYESVIIPKEEPKNTCPKCRTTDFDDCHSIKCPMRKEEPIRNYELIGECKGNPNGCFMDSCGHDCGCFTKEPKQDSNFYKKLKFSFSEKLKQYFEETPREKILEDWAKSAEFDNVGPTVDDFLNNTNKQEQTFKQKLVIELNEYDYTGSSNDIYGMVVKVNGVEMPYHNLDTSTILEEVLEYLGYEVEIIETLDR